MEDIEAILQNPVDDVLVSKKGYRYMGQKVADMKEILAEQA